MCQQQNSSGFADKGFCTCAEQTSWSLCETAEMAIDTEVNRLWTDRFISMQPSNQQWDLPAE